eukprot:360610-Rhodomonas_salina.4
MAKAAESLVRLWSGAAPIVCAYTFQGYEATKPSYERKRLSSSQQRFSCTGVDLLFLYMTNGTTEASCTLCCDGHTLAGLIRREIPVALSPDSLCPFNEGDSDVRGLETFGGTSANCRASPSDVAHCAVQAAFKDVPACLSWLRLTSPCQSPLGLHFAQMHTEEHKKAEAAKDDDNWDSSAASDDANEKSAKLDDSNWDEEDEDDAKKDAKSPQEKYAVTDTSKLDETKESNWDSSVAEEEEKAAEGKPETQNVLDETQESKWDSSDDDEKQEEEGHTGKKEEGFQLFDDLSAPPPKPVASAAEKVGLLSEEDDDDDDEEEDKKEEAKEKVGLAKKGASEKKEEKEEEEEEDQTEKEKDKEEEEEKEKEKEKVREKEKEELKAREQEKEEKKQKEKEEKKEKEKEEKRKEKEMAKEKEKEAAKEKAKEGKEEKEEEFELFDDISAPKPGQLHCKINCNQLQYQYAFYQAFGGLPLISQSLSPRYAVHGHGAYAATHVLCDSRY